MPILKKKRPCVKVTSGTDFWTCRLDFPFDKRMIALIKERPGYTYHPAAKMWEISREVLEVIKPDIEALGFVVQVEKPRQDVLLEPDIRMLPHQREGVKAILHKRVHLLHFEQGTGKTWTAIEAMRLVASDLDKRERTFRGLFVTVAKGVHDIYDEVMLRWPGTSVRNLVDNSFRLGSEDGNAIVDIVAWTSLNKVGERKYDFLVFDEVDYAKNKDSQRGADARELRDRHRYAYVVGMGGTPYPEGIFDFHGVYDFLFPNMLGSYWKFAMRYCDVQENEYGKKVTGENDEYLDELQQRLQYWTCYKSAEGLPMPEVHSHAIDVDAQIPPMVNLATATKREVQAYLTSYQDKKIPLAWPYVSDLLEQATLEDRRSIVLTWRKSSAKEVAERLRAEGYSAIILTGESTIKARRKLVEEARETDNAVLVATMDSISEAMNTLVFVSNVIVLELQWKLRTYAQTLGRFRRLNSLVDAVHIHWLVVDNAVEKNFASRVALKVERVGLLGQSITDQAMQSGLDTFETPQDFGERLGAMESWDFEVEGLDASDSL